MSAQLLISDAALARAVERITNKPTPEQQWDLVMMQVEKAAALSVAKLPDDLKLKRWGKLHPLQKMRVCAAMRLVCGMGDKFAGVF